MVVGAVRLLRLASIAICAIVVASFVVFAADQTKTASGNQQEQIAAAGTSGKASEPKAQASAAHHESPVHEAIEEASLGLTSPFSGLVASSSSEWAARGVKLLLALLVYGFGLGYLARTLRVRV